MLIEQAKTSPGQKPNSVPLPSVATERQVLKQGITTFGRESVGVPPAAEPSLRRLRGEPLIKAYAQEPKRTPEEQAIYDRIMAEERAKIKEEQIRAQVRVDLAQEAAAKQAEIQAEYDRLHPEEAGTRREIAERRANVLLGRGYKTNLEIKLENEKNRKHGRSGYTNENGDFFDWVSGDIY